MNWFDRHITPIIAAAPLVLFAAFIIYAVIAGISGYQI